jgi:glycosyltransferase involved in cell wall biosynthesis
VKFFFLSSYAHLALDPKADRVSGGAELQVALLSRELAARGHEVVIVGAEDAPRGEAVYDGVRTRPGGRFHTGGLWDTACAVPCVYGLIKEERPDYVCLLGWTAWLGFLLGAKHRTRLVYICGSDAEVDGGYRRANRLRGGIFERGLRGADQRFAMSEHQRDLMERAHLPCAMYRNLILPRKEPRQTTKDIDFLWVSRCVALKKPHLFLDLAQAIPAARFVMIIPPEDRALWESVRDRAIKLPNVEFLEGVPYREVQRYFDRAEVFVNTSDFEGFPNSFIQMGQGGGTILSLSVDPDGLLTDYGAGRCAEGDWETFLEDARELHADAAVRRALQRRCEQFVAEWHDNDRNVTAFLGGLPKPR